MKGSSICFPRQLKGSNRLNMVKGIFCMGLILLASADAWCHNMLLIALSWRHSPISTGEFMGVLVTTDGGTTLILSLHRVSGGLFLALGPARVLRHIPGLPCTCLLCMVTVFRV